MLFSAGTTKKTSLRRTRLRRKVRRTRRLQTPRQRVSKSSRRMESLLKKKFLHERLFWIFQVFCRIELIYFWWKIFFMHFETIFNLESSRIEPGNSEIQRFYSHFNFWKMFYFKPFRWFSRRRCSLFADWRGSWSWPS